MKRTLSKHASGLGSGDSAAAGAAQRGTRRELSSACAKLLLQLPHGGGVNWGPDALVFEQWTAVYIDQYVIKCVCERENIVIIGDIILATGLACYCRCNIHIG